MNAHTPAYELYRVILDYEALQEAFIDRIEDLNVSRITIDEVGGFTGGHSSKLLCQPPIKNLGPTSLAKMLKATGLVLIAVVDDERFAAVKAQMSPRKRPVQAKARIVRPAWLFTKEKAREMGKKRWAGMSPSKRSRLARKAVNARWKRSRCVAGNSELPIMPHGQSSDT